MMKFLFHRHLKSICLSFFEVSMSIVFFLLFRISIFNNTSTNCKSKKTFTVVKSKIKFLGLIFLIFSSFNLRSQDNVRGIKEPKESKLNVTYDLKVENSYGLFVHKIPIYNYESNSFNYNLELEYNSFPFNPKTPHSTVGHNWRLNFGPYIERELRGTPDELEGAGVLPEPDKNKQTWKRGGYLYGVRNSKNDFGRLVVPDGYISFGLQTYFDCNPDLFHFYISDKYKGYFLFDKDGKVRVVAEGCIVDDSKFVYQDHSQSAKVSSFTILTDDGYRYEFGNDISSLEITSNQMTKEDPFELKYDKYVNYISKWYISRIVSPNGDVLCYDYLSDKMKVAIPYFGKISQIIQLNYFSSISCPEGSDGSTANESDYSLDLNKEISFPIINTITSNAVKIKFNYNNNVVESINVYNANNDMIKTSFHYTIRDGWYFLNSITNRFGNDYVFNYQIDGKYSEVKLPSNSVSSIDYLGYWNGGYKTADFQSDGKIDTSNVDIGLLKRITLPTGGGIVINYEPNKVGKIFHFSTNKSEEIPDNVLSGVRVSSVEEYDLNNKLINKRNYTYYSNYIHDGKSVKYHSSGILTEPPRSSYTFYFIKSGNIHPTGTCSCSMNGVVTASSTSYFDNTFYNIPHIQYSEIQEYDIFNSCKTILYSTVEELPKGKKYEIKMLPYGGISYDSCDPQSYLECSGMYNCDVPINFMDKIKKIKEYTSKYNKVREIAFEYNESNIWDQCIDGIYCNTAAKKSYSIPTIPCLIKGKYETDYFDVGQVDNYEKYEYNNCYKFKSILKKTQENNIYKTYVNYIDDICLSQQLNDTLSTIRRDKDIFLPAIDRMRKLNMVGHPIEIINKLDKNGKELFLSAQVNLYRLDGLNPVLSEVKKISSNSSEYNYKPLFYSKELLSSTQPNYYWSLNVDNRMYTDCLLNKYDSKGNLLEMTKRNGIKTSYLWDYSGNEIISKAENLGYDALAAIAGPVPNSNSETDVDLFLRNLRINLKNPSVLLSTYIYKPLFGLTTSTNSNGITQKYSYDSVGRLSNVLENDKLLNHYSYHYYNDARPELFLSAKPTSLQFSYDGGSQQVAVNSNTNWSVSGNYYWLVCTISEGAIKITTAANASTNSRMGQVVLSGVGVASPIILTIVQDGVPTTPSLIATPSSFPALSGGRTGLLGTVEVTSNVCWNISYDQMRGPTPYVQVRNESGNAISGGCGSMRIQIYQIEGISTVTPSAVILKTTDGSLQKTISIGKFGDDI
jgi:hypothetical protein